MPENLANRLRGLSHPEAVNEACEILREQGFGDYLFSDRTLSDDKMVYLSKLATHIKEVATPIPTSGDMCLKLAWADFKLGNFDTCLAELEQAVQKTPENDQVHRTALNCKVFLCTKLERFDEAQEALDEYFRLTETAQAGCS